MHKKYLWGAVLALIVIAGGSFYGGMAYADNARQAARATNGTFAMGAGMASGNARFTGARGAGAVMGEVVAKDATSITLKTQNGSSKIVLIPSGTEVMKSVAGTADDLSVGADVSIIGTTNSDGSVTAQSVQIRPAGQRASSQSTPSPAANPGQ